MVLAESTGSKCSKNKNERQNMKNQNKANAGRTQIADISVAGKELSEEHLRIVGGGMPIGGAPIPVRTCRYSMTCTSWDPYTGRCRSNVDDTVCWTDGWNYY